MTRLPRLLAGLLLAASGLSAQSTTEQTRLLRFPATNGTDIVFSYAGQLYTVGHGVEPDIVVDNDPWKEFHGEDQQLDRAIAVALEELKTKRFEYPPIPPYPIKY